MTLHLQDDETARALLDSADRGDFRVARSHLARLAPAAVPSWTVALGAMEAIARPEEATPDLAALAALHRARSHGTTAATRAVRTATAVATAVMARHAFLSFEPHAARAIAEHEAQQSGLDDDPAAVWRICARAWLEVTNGRLEGLAVFLAPWPDRARTCATEALALELEALCAWSTLYTEDRVTGTDQIRVLCGRARSLRIPQVEYLAHFILAKARRAAARGYLAIRILAGLAKVLPGAWQKWLAWELALSGGSLPERSASFAPVGAVDGLVAAARSGQRSEFDSTSATLARLLEGAGEAKRDATLLALLLDPAMDSGDAQGRRWLRGDDPLSPRGLHCACPVPWSADDDDPAGDGDAAPRDLTVPRSMRQWAPIVWAVADPARGARRILWPGLGLFVGHDDALATVRAHRKQGRLDTATAVLCLAGERGLRDEDFFAAVYGFPFKRSMHQGAFDVLVHRLRQRHGGAARIHHGEGRVCLAPLRLIVAPDPRCSLVVSEHVLRWMAPRGAATAKEAAAALGLPLRTVQGELKRLADDGSCTRERRGRHIAYAVEDTIFTEPITSW